VYAQDAREDTAYTLYFLRLNARVTLSYSCRNQVFRQASTKIQAVDNNLVIWWGNTLYKSWTLSRNSSYSTYSYTYSYLINIIITIILLLLLHPLVVSNTRIIVYLITPHEPIVPSPSNFKSSFGYLSKCTCLIQVSKSLLHPKM
jgi:hypothetical protein